ICIFLRKQYLAICGNFQIMWRMEILKHLLCNSMENGRRYPTSFSLHNRGRPWRIDDYNHGNLWIVEWSKPCKRRDELGMRVGVSGGFKFLRSPCFPSRAVAIENCLAAGSVNHHALHHLSHQSCGRGRKYATLFDWVKSNFLRRVLRSNLARHNARREQFAIVGNT